MVERSDFVGVQNKNISNINLKNILGNKRTKILKYREAKTIKEAEKILSKQLHIPVIYTDFDIDTANLINETIIEEFNDIPLKNIKLTTISSYKKQDNYNANDEALATINSASEKSIYNLFINSDLIKNIKADSDWESVDVNKELYLTQKHLEQTLEKFKRINMKYSLPKPIIRNEQVNVLYDQIIVHLTEDDEKTINSREYEKKITESYIEDLTETIHQIDFLMEMKRREIECFITPNYTNDKNEFIKIALIHEIGHLHQFDLYPGSDHSSDKEKIKEIKDCMKNCRPLTVYSQLTDVENFAEHYALYRHYPEKLKKLSPNGYKKFEDMFGQK